MTELEQSLVKALVGLLVDYRTEGCADPECLVCKASRAAKVHADEAIAMAEEQAPFFVGSVWRDFA